jgi:hypothetical protein
LGTFHVRKIFSSDILLKQLYKGIRKCRCGIWSRH